MSAVDNKLKTGTSVIGLESMGLGGGSDASLARTDASLCGACLPAVKPAV